MTSNSFRLRTIRSVTAVSGGPRISFLTLLAKYPCRRPTRTLSTALTTSDGCTLPDKKAGPSLTTSSTCRAPGQPTTTTHHASRTGRTAGFTANHSGRALSGGTGQRQAEKGRAPRDGRRCRAGGGQCRRAGPWRSGRVRAGCRQRPTGGCRSWAAHAHFLLNLPRASL
jgi:hypothetical protein